MIWKRPTNTTTEISFESGARHFAFRLRPGQGLREGIEAVSADQKLMAAAVVSCAGSLAFAHLRYAAATQGTELDGPFEICSLTGTLGSVGGSHLHLSIADANGRMIGGHLLEGCIVRTTAEVILVELEELQFERVRDPESGFRELYVQKRKLGRER